MFTKVVMEDYRSDIHKFREFLVQFSKEHTVPLTDDDTLPHRLLSFFLVEDEVEAEVADWVTQYLTAQKAPNLLTSLLSRQIRDEVINWDIKSYLEPLPMSQDDDDCNDDQADRSSDTTEILEESDGSPKIEVFKLAKDVYNRLHVVCKEWAEKLPEDLSKKLPQDHKFAGISSYSIKNTRRKMEDRHIIFPYLNQLCGLEDENDQSFFGVFDGHGGTEASVYVSAHLHHNMTKNPKFKTSPNEALKEAFIKTDKDFIHKARRENLRSGSTCVCALFRDQKLHVSWLGDSQVMMVKDGQPQILMDPHKPERDDERKRIEALGGFVMWFGQWRVNATLSVSRAIGDADFKPYVSSDADMATFDLDGSEDYVVLACDGLWDTMSYEDVSKEVYNFLTKENGKKSDVAEVLVNKAKEKGSGDNITVVVLFLKDSIAKPKPMPVQEKRVVMQREDKLEDHTNENDSSKAADAKEMGKGDAEKSDRKQTEQAPNSTNLGNIGKNKDFTANKLVSPISEEHYCAGGVKNDNTIVSGKKWNFPSSDRKPLTTSHSIVNTAVTYKKPAPYNVYKVLLSHKHKTKLSAASPVEKNDETREVVTKTEGENTEMLAASSVRGTQVDNVEEKVNVPSIETDQKQGSPIMTTEGTVPVPSLNVNVSTISAKYLCLSDKQSEASSTELAIATAKRCITSRKLIKKGKNGKRRNIHRDLRRLSRDRLSLGIAERTRSNNSSGSSPRSLHARAKALAAAASGKYHNHPTSTGRPQPTLHSQHEKMSVKAKAADGRGAKSGVYTGSSTSRVPLKWEDNQLKKVVTGFGYMDISPTSPESRWTVAREIENASAMFGE